MLDFLWKKDVETDKKRGGKFIVKKIDIIILNYNGERLIPLCLPSIIEAKNNSQYRVGIIVIDNESTDNSLKLLEQFKNEVEVISHKNKFLCSFNDVVADSDADIVILLNNDIRVDKNFVDPLVEVFLEKRDAFLVAPKVLNFKGELEGGRTKGYFRFGIFWASARFKDWRESINNFSYTFSSGFGAIDRRKFVELEGYDSLYLPGRFEDVDLALRAWRRGWKLYYQPRSIVYHLGQVAFRKRFTKKEINLIDSRNLFLFMWKNIYSYRLWIEHLLFLPLWFLWWMVRGKFYYIEGFAQALNKLDKIVRRRKEEFLISEEEIFRIFRK